MTHKGRGRPRKPGMTTLNVRLPKAVIRIARKVALARGMSVNSFIASTVVSGVSAEIIEAGLLQRIVRETMVFLKEHGHPDAPVPPALPPMPPTDKQSTKKSVRRAKPQR